MKFLIQKTPDKFLKSVNDEINSILARHIDGLYPDYMYPEKDETLSIPVELVEQEKNYIVLAEIPGVKKEDLNIDVDKYSLTISAKKEQHTSEKDDYYRRTEFSYGEFSRSICFPEEVNTNEIEAKLENGVLKIELAKKEPEKNDKKKITIK